MIGRVIKPDMTSRVSYTITSINKGVVEVCRNVSTGHPEEYCGPCPKGEYTCLRELIGLDFKELFKEGPIFEVDENSLLTLK